METITNAANAAVTTASKMVFGEDTTQQSGTEPKNGEQGGAGEPFDKGNAGEQLPGGRAVSDADAAVAGIQAYLVNMLEPASDDHFAKAAEANPTTSSTDADPTTTSDIATAKSPAAKDTDAVDPSKDASVDTPAAKEIEDIEDKTEESKPKETKEGSKQHPEADPTGILSHKDGAPVTHFHADKPQDGDDRKEANPPPEDIETKDPTAGPADAVKTEADKKTPAKDTATSPSPSGKEKEKVSKLAKLKEKLKIGSKKE